jgi:hypothetical protein
VPGFLVDSRSLQALHDTLGGLRERLLGVPATVGAIDGVLGGRAVESDLRDFCSEWHHGIGGACADIGEMMRRLDGAIAAYHRLEEGVTHTTRHHRGSGTGSGTTVIGGGGEPGVGSGTTIIGPGSSSSTTTPGTGGGTTVIGS